MNAHVKGTGGEGMYSHVVEDNLMLRVLVGEGMYPHVMEDNLMLRVLVVRVCTLMLWRITSC